MESLTTPPRPPRIHGSPSPTSRQGSLGRLASPSPRHTPNKKNIDKGVNMHAMVRVRGPSEAELALNHQTGVVEFAPKNVKVVYGPNKCFSKAFQFDEVFDENTTQKEIYDTSAKSLVNNSIEGFNSTIFTYGPSGTGKSHTVQGKLDCDEEVGLITRAVYQIFEKLDASEQEYGLRISCLEIYNEELIDLLNFTNEDKRMKLVDDAHRGCVCQNLEEHCLLKPSDITTILEKANNQRIDKEQESERHLRRSNIIVTIKIMVKECNQEGDELIRQGQLNIVDFAGCEVSFKASEHDIKERYHMTDRVVDVGKINNSMLVFGRVVNAIVDGHHHIPYRDSKLTRLLQDSLGGKAKVALIATITSAKSMWEETMATLEIATRVRSIKSYPCILTKTSKRWVMKEYLQEIDELKHSLQNTREKNGVYVDPDKYFEMMATLKSYESTKDEFQKMKSQYDSLKSKKEDLNSENIRLTEDLSSTKSYLATAEETLAKTIKKLRLTQSNLDGSEAVVNEQSTTEQTLNKQASYLQDTLDARESDVEKLLSKVDRMAEKEEQRLGESATFVSQLVCNNNDLVTNMQVFQVNSQQHSAALCQTIEDMVSKGKTSSDSLSSTIHKALDALKGGVASNQNTLTSTVNDLQETLTSTQEALEETLKCLQESASTWKSDTDNKLSEAQNHLKTQVKEIEAMTTSIDKQTTVLIESTQNFVNLQEQHKSDTASTTASLKTTLQDKLDAYETYVKNEAAAMNETLRVQADEIKSTMIAFTRKLIDNATATNANILSEATSIKSNMMQINVRGEEKLTSLNKGIKDACDKHITETDTTYAEHSKSYSTAVENVSKMRNDMNAAFSANRSYNSSNGSALGQHITEVIKKGEKNTAENQSNVDSVVDKSNDIARNVDEASKTMKNTVIASHQALTETLDRDCKTISEQSVKYLEVTTDHVTEQQKVLKKNSNAASNYELHVVATKLQPFPQDPLSLQKHAKVVWAATEDHESIKNNAATMYTTDSYSFSCSNDENLPDNSRSGSKDSVLSFGSNMKPKKKHGTIFRIATNDSKNKSLGSIHSKSALSKDLSKNGKTFEVDCDADDASILSGMGEENKLAVN